MKAISYRTSSYQLVLHPISERSLARQYSTMNANMQVFRIVQIFCFLTFATVWAEDDFKTQFGEKFGEALKRYNAELLQENMDGLKEFFKAAIGDFNLSPRDERAFRMRLETIDEMKSRIGNTVTIESVKAVSGFSKLVLFELLMFRASPNIAGDHEKAEAFDKAMKKCADGEIEHVNKFLEKMQTKWNELYETIPKEEFQKHPEFQEIHESIDELLNMDKSFSGVLHKTIALAETLRKISVFFNYKEWNSILLKNRI